MRQYKLFILLIQVAVAADFMYAGFERTAQPTAVLGRAFSGVAAPNVSNVWLNPASLSDVSAFHSSIFYSPSPFQLPQLTHYGLLVADDIGFVKSALAISSLGFSLYRETFGSISAAYTDLANVSIGFTVSLFHLSIMNYGSALKAGTDVGAIFFVTDELNVGFSVHNLTGVTFGNDDDVPRMMLAGLSYKIMETAIVTFDIVKDIRYESTFRTAIEFMPHEIITVRSGIQGEPSRIFGGIGILVNLFTVEYAVVTHNDLGLTHSIGISFTP